MILYSSLDLDIHIYLSMIYKGALSYISETLSISVMQVVSSFQDTLYILFLNFHAYNIGYISDHFIIPSVNEIP